MEVPRLDKKWVLYAVTLLHMVSLWVGVGNLLIKKKTVSMIAVVAIAALLVGSVLTMHTAEAKSKTGKIKVNLSRDRRF